MRHQVDVCAVGKATSDIVSTNPTLGIQQSLPTDVETTAELLFSPV